MFLLRLPAYMIKKVTALYSALQLNLTLTVKGVKKDSPGKDISIGYGPRLLNYWKGEIVLWKRKEIRSGPS